MRRRRVSAEVSWMEEVLEKMESSTRIIPLLH